MDVCNSFRYDEVLREGLPDWKQAVYYYRRVRKMGLAEILLLLFVMVSVGHYLFGWAVYLEKLLVLVSGSDCGCRIKDDSNCYVCMNAVYMEKLLVLLNVYIDCSSCKELDLEFVLPRVIVTVM